MKKIISLTLVISFFFMILPAEDENNSTNKDKNKSGAISIIQFIPGLPQLKSKNYLKGTLFLTSFLACITGSFIYNNKGNQWYDKYKASTNVEDIILFRDNAESNFKNRNLCLIGIASIWLLHILDLKFFKSGKAGMKGDIGKNSFDIGFYYAF